MKKAFCNFFLVLVHSILNILSSFLKVNWNFQQSKKDLIGLELINLEPFTAYHIQVQIALHYGWISSSSE